MCEIQDNLAVAFAKKFIKEIEHKLRFQDEDFILRALELKAYYVGKQLRPDSINPFTVIEHRFQDELIKACSMGRLPEVKLDVKKSA